jgi:DNA-binding NarL/FixJ family response regulator
VRLVLEIRNDLQIVGEASDGLEAVRKAKELQPDLILLDIDLPTLNGIQVARRLRDLVPQARILFVSVESSADVVREALNMGGSGYVYKLHVGSELLPAIETVLAGKQFVGSMLEGNKLTDAQEEKAPRRHEVLFCPDDGVFLDGCTRFVAAALGAGDVAAVVATESHRDSLFHRLKAEGLDVDAEN